MIKFEGVEKTKSLGRFGVETGVGIATDINAKVVKAEYKRKDGKVVKSKKGNAVIDLFCKVSKPITKKDGTSLDIPTFFNVSYYETEFSPKLKEVSPVEGIDKFVNIRYNTGGENAFGNFRIYNKKKEDGSISSGISIYGGNVKKANKKNGVYYVKDFNGEDVPMVMDSEIRLLVKGFLKPINDTEEFLMNNYNERAKTLKFEMYYLENEGDNKYNLTLPMILENIESKDVAMNFVEFVKNNTEKLIAMRCVVSSYPVYGDKKEEEVVTQSAGFGNYEDSGASEVKGYEHYACVEFDEDKKNWKIKVLKSGKVIIDDNEDDADLDFPF